MGATDLISIVRPKHWVKNVLLFFPLLFAARFGEQGLLWQVLGGFGCFSVLASAVYVFNDVRDAPTDRLHPHKKLRPVASGAIAPGVAMLLSAVLCVGALGTALLINEDFAGILAAYLLLNIAYSLGLKKIALVDITIIAVGFLLRILAGGALTDIPISQWLILMTFLLALFLGIAKRRDDVVLAEATGQVLRESTRGYSLRFIDSAMVLFSAVLVVSYIMYSVSPEVTSRMNSEFVYLTALPVIVGVLRYLQIVLVLEQRAEPTAVLLRDHFLQLMIAAWLGGLIVILYF